MSNVLLAVVLQGSILATGGNAYEEAYNVSTKTGKPLVVLVGAEWCPGCRTMKNNVVPQLRKNGALEGVAYAEVNSDQQPQLARELSSGGSIPQLVIYHQDKEGWNRQVFVGARSVAEVERLINAAIDDSKSAGKLVSSTR